MVLVAMNGGGIPSGRKSLKAFKTAAASVMAGIWEAIEDTPEGELIRKEIEAREQKEPNPKAAPFATRGAIHKVNNVENFILWTVFNWMCEHKPHLTIESLLFDGFQVLDEGTGQREEMKKLLPQLEKVIKAAGWRMGLQIKEWEPIDPLMFPKDSECSNCFDPAGTTLDDLRDAIGKRYGSLEEAESMLTPLINNAVAFIIARTDYCLLHIRRGVIETKKASDLKLSFKTVNWMKVANPGDPKYRRQPDELEFSLSQLIFSNNIAFTCVPRYKARGTFPPVDATHVDEEDHKATFYTYMPPKISYRNYPPDEMAGKRILNHYQHLILHDGNAIKGDNGQTAYDYFMKWCRLVVVQGQQSKIATFIASDTKGSGKTIAIDALMNMTGETQSQELTVRDVESGRYTATESKTLVYMKELDSAETKMDAKKLVNNLKKLITDRSMSIQPLYMDAFTVQNRVNVIADSNHERLPLESGDRRFFVINAIEKRLDNIIAGQLSDDVCNLSALKWFYNYLAAMPVVSVGELAVIPETPLRRTLREVGKTSADEFYEWVKFIVDTLREGKSIKKIIEPFENMTFGGLPMDIIFSLDGSKWRVKRTVFAEKVKGLYHVWCSREGKDPCADRLFSRPWKMIKRDGHNYLELKV